jgi:hypothetical protein
LIGKPAKKEGAGIAPALQKLLLPQACLAENAEEMHQIIYTMLALRGVFLKEGYKSVVKMLYQSCFQTLDIID